MQPYKSGSPKKRGVNWTPKDLPTDLKLSHIKIFHRKNFYPTYRINLLTLQTYMDVLRKTCRYVGLKHMYIDCLMYKCSHGKISFHSDIISYPISQAKTRYYIYIHIPKSKGDIYHIISISMSMAPGKYLLHIFGFGKYLQNIIVITHIVCSRLAIKSPYMIFEHIWYISGVNFLFDAVFNQ